MGAGGVKIVTTRADVCCYALQGTHLKTHSGEKSNNLCWCVIRSCSATKKVHTNTQVDIRNYESVYVYIQNVLPRLNCSVNPMHVTAITCVVWSHLKSTFSCSVPQCSLPKCSVQCAVCSVQCAVCSVQCAVCSVQCAVCSHILSKTNLNIALL